MLHLYIYIYYICTYSNDKLLEQFILLSSYNYTVVRGHAT